MTEHEMMRCPSCDTANPTHATFCTSCGKPMGDNTAVAPAGLLSDSVGASDGRGLQGYVVAAAAIAAVLVVGGVLFLLADANETSDPDGASSPSQLSEASTETMPVTAAPATATVAPTSAATTVLPTTSASAVTTVPLPTEAPTTVAAAPTAPPPTLPPATAAPAPVPAPVPAPTAAPAQAVTLSFAQADSFFRSYIATAAGGDYNTAWNMLSSSDRADYTNGFDQFVGFWQSVSSAEVQRVASVGGSVGFQSLLVDMAYGQADGDPTSFEVVEVDVNVRPDGFLQIFDYRYIGKQ